MKPVPLPFSFPTNQRPCIYQQGTSVVHHAKWLVVDPWTIVENAYLHIQNGVVVSASSEKPSANETIKDHGSAALAPALINAHTHLELSALQGKIAVDQGFRNWIKDLIAKRDQLNIHVLREGVTAGIKQLVQSGCRVVGDISTLGITQDLLATEPVAGICFSEMLGSIDNFQENSRAPSQNMKAGLAGHAPHTTAPDLLRKIKQVSRQRKTPMSIHVSESEDECLFITTGKGPWADFLKQRGIDFSNWPLGATSPVTYLFDLGILDNQTLAVHLTYATRKDIELLCQHRIPVCLCPRSNHALHDTLPDIEKMLAAGMTPCLGTDSLASTPSLSILDEMAFIAATFQTVSPETIFSMGTINGAQALGFGGKFGRLEPGHFGAAAVFPVDCHHKQGVIESILCHDR